MEEEEATDSERESGIFRASARSGSESAAVMEGSPLGGAKRKERGKHPSDLSRPHKRQNPGARLQVLCEVASRMPPLPTRIPRDVKGG
mmetsp:Transcript_16766/g.37422  ORF Transcript_16766/g.37422 Transcript_16766/m.37422 type:complete len:88 (+) Transcript_16766:537-800(+)